jgi:hypothetical protein
MKQLIYACLLLSVLFLVRCIPVDGQFIKFRNSILKSIEGDIDVTTDVEFRLDGRHGLGSFLGACADEDRDSEESFEGISKIQVGVYKLSGVADYRNKKLTKIPKRMEKMGWEKIVKARDEDGYTWIYGKTSTGDCIEALSIVHLDSHELVMVQMEGVLDNFVEREIDKNDLENLKKFRL